MGWRSDKKKNKKKVSSRHNNGNSNSNDNKNTSTGKVITKQTSGDDWLVFEILNRLPVKTLTRFKIVSKRWRYLIERDQQFIDLHFTRSKTRLPSRLFIVVPLPHTRKQKEVLKSFQGTCFSDRWPYKEFHLTAHLLFEEEEEEDYTKKVKLVVDTVRKINSSSYNFISKPVNGLVCLIDSCMNRVVRIYNISTGDMSPSFELSSIVMGKERVTFPNFLALGFDPATNKHKLVFVLTVNSGHLDSESFVCGVLTIGRRCNNNRWRRIEEIPPYELNDDYVYVNGVIYWSNHSLDRWGRGASYRPVCLVAFDVGTEKFRTITIPDFMLDQPRVLDEYSNFKDIAQLFEVDGYLTMIVKLDDCTFNMYIYQDDYYKDGDEKFNETSSTSSLKNGRWSEVSWINLPFYMMNGHDVKFHTFIGSDDKILVTSSTSGKKRMSIYCYNWKNSTWTKVDVSGIPSSVPKLRLRSFSTTFSESLLPLNNQS